MIKIFTLVLDLLQIPFSSEHIALAEKLIEAPNNKIISFYANGFVFSSFQELLLNKISQEDFVLLGDSFGKLYEYQNNPILAKEALVYGLSNDSKQYENTYIILDKKDQIYIEKSLPLLEKILKKIKSQIYYM